MWLGFFLLLKFDDIVILLPSPRLVATAPKMGPQSSHIMFALIIRVCVYFMPFSSVRSLCVCTFNVIVIAIGIQIL